MEQKRSKLTKHKIDKLNKAFEERVKLKKMKKSNFNRDYYTY
jgi:hypothetical protein